MSCIDKPLVTRTVSFLKIVYNDGKRIIARELYPKREIKIFLATIGCIEYLAFVWSKEAAPWTIEKKNIEWIEIDDERINAGEKFLK